jgi:hypothetical protein
MVGMMEWDDLKAIVCEVFDRIDLAQGTVQRRAVVRNVMNRRIL